MERIFIGIAVAVCLLFALLLIGVIASYVIWFGLIKTAIFVCALWALGFVAEKIQQALRNKEEG